MKSDPPRDASRPDQPASQTSSTIRRELAMLASTGARRRLEPKAAASTSSKEAT